MASKRKAQDAYGASGGRLSAVAAARLAKQQKQNAGDLDRSHQDEAATEIAATAYQDPMEDQVLVEAIDSLSPSSVSSSTPLSNYSAKNVIRDDESRFEVTLKSDQFLTVYGEYDLEIVKGVATIYGATLQQSDIRHRVHAPTVQALPQIVTRKNDTHLRIHPVKKSASRLEPLSPLFRGLWPKEGRSFQPLRSSANDPARSVTVLDFEKDAQQLCSKLATKLVAETNVRTMAIGAKSSGKSTFNRFLCNSLLTRSQHRKCNYLDLDPGQPEFCPPGILALVEVRSPIIGPSFTHSAARDSHKYRLVRSHALAATTFKDDPDHYIVCARDLFRHVDKSIPLIVNACGWVSGLGAKIIRELIPILNITDLIIFDPVDDTSFQPLDMRHPPATHHLFRRQARPSLRTPSELRAMQTMASFHHRLASDHLTSQWISTPIEQWRPWLISFGSSTEAPVARAILSLDPQPPNPAFLHEILPGSIVAIVVTNSLASTPNIERTDEDIPFVPPNPQTGLCDPLEARQSECIGLALLRGIDLERKEFQLVTALQEMDIAALNDREKAVYLVRGTFDAPEWAYLEGLHAGTESKDVELEDRPWISKREMVGIQGAVWRLRHPPTAAQLPSR